MQITCRAIFNSWLAAGQQVHTFRRNLSSSASAAFVYNGSVQDGQVHLDIFNLFLSAGKVIAVKHAKVGKAAGCKRSLVMLLACEPRAGQRVGSATPTLGT